jgi:hypothetical protein
LANFKALSIPINKHSKYPIKQQQSQQIPLVRDSDAMVRAPQKGAPLGTRNCNVMPRYDKQNVSNVASRPTLPTLGAAAKTSNKTPLTPRVAGSNPLLASTPLARRGARLEPSVTPTVSSQSAFDISTPVSAFLNSNITPRSSSRKSRVDSTNTTPTHTPSGTPTPDPLPVACDYGANQGFTGFDSGPKRSTISFNSTLSEVESQRDILLGESDTKFFYASDAKSPTQASRRQAQQHKNPFFFYANGDSIPPPISSSGSTIGSAVESSIVEERNQPKFFHANGNPDLWPQPSHSFSSQSSNVSTTSHFSSPRLVAQTPAASLSSLQRPKSPPKPSQNIPPSSLKNVTTIHPSPLPIPSTGHSALEILPKNRASNEIPRKASSHEKSASVGTLDISPSTKRVSVATPVTPPSPLSPSNFAPAHLASTPEGSLSGGDNGESLQEEIKSPVKIGHSLKHLNELAANARRERKVLDLEITNSSLAAINRTLEREIRKQTAELRRYRRLSRSGRLSINTAVSIRTSNGTLSAADEADSTRLSDMSEGDEDYESSEDSVDDSSLSPTAIAESDARHREKDEKRLMLDLSKHQQLLIDSQKMNQSLKRCLGWTEELIKEGKKALAFNVRVSDVRLGGRVLAPDEAEDDGDGALWKASIGVVDQASGTTLTSGWSGEGKDDRDSGIELDSDNVQSVKDCTKSPPEIRQ